MSKITRNIRATQVGILTDFGLRNPYVSEVKCSILGDIGTLEVNIIDISHSVEPYNILEGAYLLYSSSRWFPEGSILVGIIDPGVGTNVSSLIVRTERETYIGPDNGLLIPSARADGKFTVFKINENIIKQERISEVFYGRDIFARIANLLLKGRAIENLGMQIEEYADLNLFKYQVKGAVLTGTILFVDDFGDIVTNIPFQEIKNSQVSEFEVSTRMGTFRSRFVKSYGFANLGELIVTVGSEGLLEIAMNKSSAENVLHTKIGDEVSFHYHLSSSTK
jgi:hypothetical protein